MRKIVPAFVLVGAALGAPAAASAAGGLFCDADPPDMAVEQTGQNILFVAGDGYVDAHLQLQYDPDSTAPSFAWIVPVTAVPEFFVGSALLFETVLQATVPTFATTAGDQCPAPTSGGGGSGGTFSSPLDMGVDDPDVVLEETVGVFDVVVLQGGTVDSVMQWLGTNGYEQDPAAAPILAEYLAEGFLFAALELTNGADLSGVHPVVLRIPGGEPAVPLRLTRIAARDDMDVRVMFLGERRMVPTNYGHLRLNPVRLDWMQAGSNYGEVVRRAVDEGDADGHAFLTEFAGSSDVADPGRVSGELWDAQPFATVPVVEVVDLLEAQGLVACVAGEGCQYLHPLVRGLLTAYLPVPAGVEEGLFYGCLACYQGQIDLQAWDGPKFAADVADRIVAPGLAAADALMANPVLTRMYTRISPGEMTDDPRFHPHPTPEPGEVSNALGSVAHAPCDANGLVYVLPDGREVFTSPTDWPDIADMPWVEEVERIPYVGPPQVFLDNTKRIDELLAEHNAANGWPPGAGSTGGASGDDGGGSTGGGTTKGSGGANGQATATCACRNDVGSGRSLAMLLLVLLLSRRRG